MKMGSSIATWQQSWAEGMINDGSLTAEGLRSQPVQATLFESIGGLLEHFT